MLFRSDGRLHNVPVPWDEYIPVENTNQMLVKRIATDEKEFDSKKASLDASAFNTPYAYYHGLFAKILGNDSVEYLDSVL